MKYKTLLIDLDGTLFDFEKCEKGAFKECLEINGYAYTDKLYSEYSEINKSLWEKFEKNEIKKEDVMVGRFKKLSNALEGSIDAKLLSKLYLERLSKSTSLNKDVYKVLDYLSKKYELYVVTNGFSTVQINRLEKTNLLHYFTAVFISESIGFQKPNKAFFNFCFENSTVKPESALIIGDSLSSDILGGFNSGIDTCWYNPKGETAPETYHVDYHITELNQLMDFL